MLNDKTVVIIGAGLSGLVAAKKIKDAGLTPIVLEKKADLGGLWNPKTGSMWDSMRTNLSYHTCSFNDYPWPEGTETFPSHKQVYQYLHNYAKHFELEQYIKFSSKVSLVTKAPNGYWLVSYNYQIIICKYLIIASGVFSAPHLPAELLELQKTKTVIHSSAYKNPTQFLNKKVAIVGSGFSAMEIAAEIAPVAKSVEHMIRTIPWVIPRNLPQGPLDLVFYDASKRQDLTEVIFKDDSAYQKTHGYMATLSPEQAKEGHPLYINPNSTTPPYVTISEHYLGLLAAQKITVHRDLTSKVIDADIIVACTGFTTNLDYLDYNTQCTLNVSETNQFHPVLAHKCTFAAVDNLALISMYRGPYFKTAELQAAWIAGVFSGTLPKPSADLINTSIEQEEKIRLQKPRPQFPHADYVGFKHDLTQLINQKQPALQWSYQRKKVLAILAAATAATIITGYSKNVNRF